MYDCTYLVDPVVLDLTFLHELSACKLHQNNPQLELNRVITKFNTLRNT